MSTQYQSGYKLRNLKAFVKAVVGGKIAGRMDCEMSNISLSLTPKNMGNGFDLMNQRYIAEFLFDKFPHREYDPAVLFANVGAWLLDNDIDRDDFNELGDPEIEVVIEDEVNAEVLITIEFEEPVKIVELVDGPIFWKNKRWTIAEYDIDVATAFQLSIEKA
ncbi:MAG: hypothetical protein ACJAT7_002743 [Psychromonas sp.]|jgi:hypothetical protein|uniref:phage tail protein n=1 Tax=Psychromonas sp. TaxID=1884585 RepID=UPI0039E4E650